MDKGLHDLLKAIEKLGVHDHLCLIYETREEQFAAVIPFMKIGLERGEKCVYIADDNTAEIVIAGMKAAGMDVETAVESGKLAVVSKQDAYLKQGYFDPDWMISFLKQTADDAKASGFSAVRATGEMTWALGGDPGTERLIEYEAKLNYFFPENDMLAICQYNRKRFSAEIIKYVISTHPFVIYGGMVCRNFYYVPPDEFLGEEQPDKEIDRLLANIKNREEVDKSLRESEEYIRKLLENSPVAKVISSGPDEKIISVNKKFTELFGYTIDDVPDVEHWRCRAYPDEEYREAVKAQWKARIEKAIMERSEIEPIESTVACKDGSYRYVELRFSSIGEHHLVTFLTLPNARRPKKKRSTSTWSLKRAWRIVPLNWRRKTRNWRK